MGTKRIVELAAMLMIGDGVLGFAAPSRHSLLWDFGPEGYREAIEVFAEHPMLTRLVSAAEIGLGLGLAFRQYAKEG